MTKRAKTESLNTRVSPEAKAKFYKLAAELDLQPSELVRELVNGFTEGRVTIIPPKQEKEALYNVHRIED